MRSRTPRGRGAARAAPRLLVAALATAGCAPEQRDFAIASVRERAVPGLRFDATSEERFGAVERPAAPFDYELPPGWRELPAGPMRDVELRTADGVEVSVARLPGDGGGAAANLDRWRLQLGLAPAGPGAVDALPRQPLLDGSAYRIDLDAADGARRLVGLMLFRGSDAVFARLGGPPELVARELPAFAAFLGSLRDAAPRPSAPRPEAAAGLRWTAPADWFALPPGEGRIARFRVALGVEASLTVLGGDGGGLAANVARWSEQLGRPAPGEAALRAMPDLPLLGGTATLVELDGGPDARALVAVVCPLPGRTLFAKLEGPGPAVRARRTDFLVFCAGLTATD